jgi:A/G-specific adenine glycosylase
MNLKKAARIMMEQFDGRLPDTVEMLKTLPGIGEYSAGAVASIAFGVKTCAVDGNVLRVMARLTADSGNIDDPSVKRRLTEEVKKLLPESGAGDFNQALMDLGATICLPNGEPRCPECPARLLCEAEKAGIASIIPKKSKARDRRIEKKTVFILAENGRIALRKRGPDGLLANLWEFPHTEGFLSLEECDAMLNSWGIPGYDILPGGEAKHVFSHLEWHMKGFFIAVRDKKFLTDWTWVSPEEIRRTYSIPTAFKGFMKWIDKKC